MQYATRPWQHPGVIVEEVIVRPDRELVARMKSARPLLYDEGGCELEDRPPVVRAGSALRWLGGRLAVVQDDASFLALVGAESVQALALPRAESGRRRFESRLGNKAEKLDLEAALVIRGAGRERLFAFGSGSTSARERIVVVDADASVRVVDAAPLYAMLREHTDFSGSELNVEGAAVSNGKARLFQRGNGAPARGLEPVNATIDLDLEELVAWVDGSGTLPRPVAIRRYDLGLVAGVRFGFTDAVTLPSGKILFVAGAEDSPNTYDDGVVLGCRFGILEEDGGRFTDLRDADGALSRHKIEGIAVGAGEELELVAVTDQDDPDAPALLCEIELQGPW
ncbi:MAG: hypothetical protein H5U40_12040 [Polyangiaceae bacterium]|nr:hypothetical protein [Polyangiaceae bacterium]